MPKIPSSALKPYWQTTDESYKLYHGDVRSVLRRLPSGLVQTVVTSPPYWGLRDYGVEGQLGSEKTPEEFVANMVEVFREVRRVLRDDGTVWLNLGDNYASKLYSEDRTRETVSDAVKGVDGAYQRRVARQSNEGTFKIEANPGVKPGNLMGMPWRVALALQADGWILRQDIIWAKPSPMPESVRNRCTKSHEYIFLLAKRSGYYYDCDAIREKTGSEVSPEEYAEIIAANGEEGNSDWYQRETSRIADGSKSGNPYHSLSHPDGRNKRSVWNVASESYAGAHFATFPKKLIEPCILAGTSERGACAKCGAPLKRIVERDRVATRGVVNPKALTAPERVYKDVGRHVTSTETIGWEATCSCEMEDDSDLAPCIVLDPFAGSATALEVALNNGRNAIGIELKEEYLLENAIPRMEGALLARPAMAHLTGRKAERVELGEDC